MFWLKRVASHLAPGLGEEPPEIAEPAGLAPTPTDEDVFSTVSAAQLQRLCAVS